MKSHNQKISYLILLATLCFGTVNSFADSAPGAEDRCARARDECASNANDVGGAERCSRAYTNCINRSSSSGSAYQKCRSEGGSVEDCRGGYQKGMGNT